MARYFSIIASTINGAIQEFPKRVQLICGQVQMEGETIIRDYDANFCIVNKKVFLIRYGHDLFGTTQFKTKAEFASFVNNQCCVHCVFEHKLIYNDCILSYNGCELKYPC